MTTSGVATFNPVRDIIVKRALRMVGAFSSFDQPDSVQMRDAYDILNSQIKTWQVENFLWLREFAVLNLVSGQSVYTLSSGTSDNFTYQNGGGRASRPTKVFAATYKDNTGNEIPLFNIGRSDYLNIATKTSMGRAVQYYYDPQIAEGKLYLWPTPDDSTASLILDIDRPLQDVLTDQNTVDLPQEWVEVLSYGLAVALAPEYGLSVNERRLLRAEFDSLRNGVLANDRGTGSIFFQVGRY